MFIVSKFKEYTDGQTYAWANVYRTREEAEQAINEEIYFDLDSEFEGSGISGDDFNRIVDEVVELAWSEGDGDESHDAILRREDFTAYYDIFEVSPNRKN